MLHILAIDVNVYQVKMLMFCNVQTINLTSIDNQKRKIYTTSSHTTA